MSGRSDSSSISHPDVDRVILTGAWETAALFRSWRPDLPLLAETSGKNAMIVMPSADLDLAASDLVKSAFGHAGQKCSAASLAILVGPVGRSERFARQLVDAVRSLRVAPPSDPTAEVGPVIEPPQGKLAWALTTLDEGEKWLVQPEELDYGPEFAGRFWTPGIRTGVQPGSRFHEEEFFGPVLGIMTAPSLAQAHRAAERRGVRAHRRPLHARTPTTSRRGSTRCRRGTSTSTAASRGPSCSVSPSAAGSALAWAPAPRPVARTTSSGWDRGDPRAGATPSSTLHLRGLDSRITGIVEAAPAEPGLRGVRVGAPRRASPTPSRGTASSAR